MTYKIAIVGLGKIARDQQVPAITAHPDFDLVAVASRNARLDGVAPGPPRSGLPGTGC